MSQDQTVETVNEKQLFNTQIIFIKASHFTSPESPNVFKSKQQYDNQFEIAVSFSELEEHVHEVVLKLTVKTYPKAEEREIHAGKLSEIDPDAVPVYTAIVEQAGVFVIKGFDDLQSARIKKVACAEILFPFARAHIVNVVTQGGFPPVYLSPINFGAVNMQAEEKKAKQEEQGEITAIH